MIGVLTLQAMAVLSAATLRVEVKNIKTSSGEIGCSLFAGEEGYPMDAEKAYRGGWIEAKKEGVSFVFEGLEPGVYAVAVSHDRNGNRKTDTNFLGIPKEDWGVSNNVRPSLRAPRFDEARFELEGSKTIEIEID